MQKVKKLKKKLKQEFEEKNFFQYKKNLNKFKKFMSHLRHHTF